MFQVPSNTDAPSHLQQHYSHNQALFHPDLRQMVTANREGQSVFYTLSDKRIIKALDLLRAVLASALESQGKLALTVTQNQS